MSPEPDPRKGATRLCRSLCSHGVPRLGVPGFRAVKRDARETPSLLTGDVADVLGGSNKGLSPSWKTGVSPALALVTKRLFIWAFWLCSAFLGLGLLWLRPFGLPWLQREWGWLGCGRDGELGDGALGAALLIFILASGRRPIPMTRDASSMLPSLASISTAGTDTRTYPSEIKKHACSAWLNALRESLWASWQKLKKSWKVCIHSYTEDKWSSPFASYKLYRSMSATSKHKTDFTSNAYMPRQRHVHSILAMYRFDCMPLCFCTFPWSVCLFVCPCVCLVSVSVSVCSSVSC